MKFYQFKACYIAANVFMNLKKVIEFRIFQYVDLYFENTYATYKG
jgi:hypothetical protein